MQILKDTDELYVRPILHWVYQDTVTVIIIEDK